MKKLLSLSAILFIACSAIFSQTINVTFRVDMSRQPLGPGGFVTLNGSFNNWCGDCAPMTAIGSDVYELVVPLDSDAEYDYKFTVGNFVIAEEFIPGDPCTATAFGFTNRKLITGSSDMELPTVCFGACTSCAEAPPRAFVNFKVNVSGYTGDLSGGLRLNGTFNNWCGDCAPMADAGDGIYSLTVLLDTGSHAFKFTVAAPAGGGDAVYEDFPSDLSCTTFDGTFRNRSLVLTASSPDSLTAGPFCWNSCNICEPTGIARLAEQSKIILYPNPVINELTIESPGERLASVAVYTVTGGSVLGRVCSGNSSEKIETSTLAPGVYFLRLNTDKGSVVRRFVRVQQ